MQLEGYVRLEGGVGVYRLTEKILEMSGGFTEKSLLVEVGSPLALRLTKAIKWPVALGVLDGDAIVVRYSGMPYSPIAAHSTTIGQRLELANTAMGKAYLAFCPEVEREILSKQAMPVMLTPADLAGVFLFLASDGAAPLTGQCLVASHGEVMA